MNPRENGLNEVEQNGRGEFRGFSEGSERLIGGFPVFHKLYGHDKGNGNV